jgi:import inner membrane translocase subunit TIM9
LLVVVNILLLASLSGRTFSFQNARHDGSNGWWSWWQWSSTTADDGYVDKFADPVRFLFVFGRLLSWYSDSQRLFNEIGEKCFDNCILDFKKRELDGEEQKCVRNCADKYLNAMNRIGKRFNEENARLQTEQQKPIGV